MANGDFKNLPRRTTSDKVFCDKAFIIAKNVKYDGYQRGPASMAYKCFDKKTALITDKSVYGGAAESGIMPNQELTEELHKPIIRKFKKRKVHSSFL